MSFFRSSSVFVSGIFASYILNLLPDAFRMASEVATTLVDSTHTASRESLRFATLARTGIPFGERKSK